MSVVETSSFSPRVEPRPKYPSLPSVLKTMVWLYARDVTLGVMLCLAFFRPYQALDQALGLSDRQCYALTISIAHSGSWLVFNGGVYLLELQGLIAQFKMTRKSAEVPAPSLLSALYKEASVNHFITSPIAAFGLYSVAVYCGTPSAAAPLPPLPALMVLFAAAHGFNDVFFYATHRMLHSKLLYKRFHKQHHTFRGSVGAAAEYAHPVEVLVSNQLPTMGLVLALGLHPLVQAAWLTLRLLQTYEVHSGYAFNEAWAGKVGIAACGAAFHDHHHSVNMGCFGAEHMDWLFGTMDHWVRDGGEQGYLEKRGVSTTTTASKTD